MKRMLCIAAMMMLGVVAPTLAVAQVGVSVYIGSPPPPVRYENLPPPRAGYLWAPGYWNWDGRRHVWLGGHWEQARYGSQYHPAQWRQERDGWRLHPGGWQRGDRRHGRGYGYGRHDRN